MVWKRLRLSINSKMRKSEPFEENEKKPNRSQQQGKVKSSKSLWIIPRQTVLKQEQELVCAPSPWQQEPLQYARPFGRVLRPQKLRRAARELRYVGFGGMQNLHFAYKNILKREDSLSELLDLLADDFSSEFGDDFLEFHTSGLTLYNFDHLEEGEKSEHYNRKSSANRAEDKTQKRDACAKKRDLLANVFDLGMLCVGEFRSLVGSPETNEKENRSAINKVQKQKGTRWEVERDEKIRQKKTKAKKRTEDEPFCESNDEEAKHVAICCFNVTMSLNQRLPFANDTSQLVASDVHAPKVRETHFTLNFLNSRDRERKRSEKKTGIRGYHNRQTQA